MTALAPTLQAFFTDRLTRQRQASPQTIAAYRDTWRLLLAFTARRTGRQPGQLDFADLDAPLIGSFLDHLEHDRGNSPRTRNARLAAIHSMFGYAALQHPEHAQSIARVLASRPGGSTRPWSPGSPSKNWTRCSPRRTTAPGPGGATTPCSHSPPRPACGSPS
jgi:site-specific recombinase XerD